MTISEKVPRDKRLTRGKFQNRIATGSFFCHAEEEKIPRITYYKRPGSPLKRLLHLPQPLIPAPRGKEIFSRKLEEGGSFA